MKERRLSDKFGDVSNLDVNNKPLKNNDNKRFFALGNRLWHTDGSFKKFPAKYSLLSSRKVAKTGGETQFVDMRAAYDALSEDKKSRIKNLISYHSLIYSRQKLGLDMKEMVSAEEIKNFIEFAEQSKDQSIIGERVKRSESLFFKLCYQFHKFLTLAFTGQSIKFGNFTCLSKSTVEKMLNEKATWNSFSGSLKKTEKNLLSIPSIRGSRYFGPSKMSFFSLLKHSISIISVFRKTVLIRSALFIIFYILLIKNNASIITSIPLLLLLAMIYSISSLALRENMDGLDNSLKNINDIEKIK